jgi:hypothetical protein
VRRALTLLLLCLFGSWAVAQGPDVIFDASLSTYDCAVGEQVVLELKLTGSLNEPAQPTVPQLPGVDVQPAGVSNNISIINGVTSSASTYTYILTPRTDGRHRIPPIQVMIGGATYSTQPLTLNVRAAGTSRPPVGSPPLFPPPLPGQNPWGGPPAGFDPVLPTVPQGLPLLVECEVSNPQPYVNELVVYTFRFLHRVQLLGNSNYEPPSATGFLREDLGQTTYNTERNGTTYACSEVKTAFFPISSGPLTIGPTRLTCQIQPDPFGDPAAFMADPMRELSSDPIQLQVQPLPAEGRPPSFKGAVGKNISWQLSLNRDQVKVGEPARLQVAITGDCHQDLFTEPQLPNWPGIRSYSPESTASPYEKPNFRVTKTFKYPLVPLQPGNHDLSGLSWSYFDPQSARYVTLTAPKLSFSATGQAIRADKAPASVGTGGKSTAANPLSGPWLGFGWNWGWSRRPALFVLALAPWLLTGLVWFSSSARRRFEAHRQTPQARLGRAVAGVRKAPDLEALFNLAYPALEIRHRTPLKGLPLQRLREILPGHVVDELEAMEALRYAPDALTSPERLETFRKVILEELQS